MNATEIGLKPASLYDEADRALMRKWDGVTEQAIDDINKDIANGAAKYYFPNAEPELHEVMKAIVTNGDVRAAFDAAVLAAAEREL